MKKSLLAIALLSSISTVTLANQAGDFLVRGGATQVAPESTNAAVFVDGNYFAPLSVDDDTQFGANFVYFFDSNWAIELLAATPYTHDVLVGGAKAAEVTHLPPTLSALYYIDTGTEFKPYVGLGLNYTEFFEEEFTAASKAAGLTNLKLDTSFGYSVQIGADYDLGDNWSVNASIRYIDLNSDATFDVGGESIGKADIDIDPMVYSLMLGYTF